MWPGARQLYVRLSLSMAQYTINVVFFPNSALASYTVNTGVEQNRRVGGILTLQIDNLKRQVDIN